MVDTLYSVNRLLAVSDKNLVQTWSGFASFAFLFFLLFLLHRGKLKASYSLLWLGGWALCSFFIIFPSRLDALSNFLGVAYSPTLLLLLMVFAIALILLHFTIVITRQSKQINLLAQEIALIKREKSSCED